jgi:predicted nucleic acid-binding protein
MTIFDTDIFTDYSKGHEKIGQRVDRMAEGEVLAVTLITRMEVLRGRFDNIVKAANDEELKTAVERLHASEELLDDFALAPIDAGARQKFELLKKHKKTKKMKRADMLIASVALAQDALLVTRNTKDYKDVPGLRVENWAD